MAPRIVFEIGGQRVVHELDGDVVTVGRSARNDIVVEHSTVSRVHAKLVRDGDAWTVQDLGSTYGTRVNDQEQTDQPLRHGDRIFLHRFPLTFVTEGETEPLPSTPGASLTMDQVGHSVFQKSVDFSALASVSADVLHLQKLLKIASKASEVILASESIDETFGKVLDLVFEHLPVERGFVMLLDEERENLVTRCVKHRAGSRNEPSEIRFSKTIADKVVDDNMAVLTSDAQADGRFSRGESIVALGIRAAMAAPLWNGERVDGLIYADALKTKAFDSFDLDLLSALGNQIAVAVEQTRLRESVMRQRLVRRRLERYHSPAVVERIARADESVADVLVADERDVTVVFADVVAFTERCAKLEPREIAELLNRYFSEMAERIFRHEGTLDKFIGDCVMAVFGAPLEAADHARRAVEAALDMREALEELNRPLPPEQRLRVRVGVHSGRVVAGDIGSPRRRDYTVLGSTVNLAARLESEVAEPDQIVLSEATWSQVAGDYETRPLGEHRPSGIGEQVACHELLGRREAR